MLGQKYNNKIIHFFGSNENFGICFWDLLTFKKGGPVFKNRIWNGANIQSAKNTPPHSVELFLIFSSHSFELLKVT